MTVLSYTTHTKPGKKQKARYKSESIHSLSVNTPPLPLQHLVFIMKLFIRRSSRYSSPICEMNHVEGFFCFCCCSESWSFSFFEVQIRICVSFSFRPHICNTFWQLVLVLVLVLSSIIIIIFTLSWFHVGLTCSLFSLAF